MSILKVARMGHPVLRQKARAIDRRDIGGAAIQRLIDDMLETMSEYHGVGLAAPQVHESVRLFVALLERESNDGAAEENDESDEARDRAIVIVNPEISIVSNEMVEDWEGCLSIPDIRGRVPRAREIKVRALDRHGDRVEIGAQDFAARVIQHETDHLDGVLFFDRMKNLGTLTFLEEYSRYWAKD